MLLCWDVQVPAHILPQTNEEPVGKGRPSLCGGAVHACSCCSNSVLHHVSVTSSGCLVSAALWQSRQHGLSSHFQLLCNTRAQSSAAVCIISSLALISLDLACVMQVWAQCVAFFDVYPVSCGH